jgi:hypothetical protein
VENGLWLAPHPFSLQQRVRPHPAVARVDRDCWPWEEDPAWGGEVSRGRVPKPQPEWLVKCGRWRSMGLADGGRTNAILLPEDGADSV